MVWYIQSDERIKPTTKNTLPVREFRFGGKREFYTQGKAESSAPVTGFTRYINGTISKWKSKDCKQKYKNYEWKISFVNANIQ